MNFSLTLCFSHIATALITLFVIFYLYAKYKLLYWKRRGVKSPPTHIVFGNIKELAMFQTPPGQVLRDIYFSVDPEEPFVGCYVFHKPCLILRSREVIKQVMIKDYDIFPNRGFGGELEADPLGFVSLLSIRYPRFKYLRAKMTPCVTGQKLRNMFPLVLECSKNLIEHIENEIPDSTGAKSFELKDTAGKYCTDVFASVAFGITTNCFDPNNTEFWNAGQSVLYGLKRGIFLMTHFFLPEVVRLTALVSRGPAKFFRDIFWHSFSTREQVGNKRGDFVDSLIALKNGEQNPDFVFDGDNLVAQAVSFYVAGFEATSTAIAFTLYELSRHPEHEETIYEEIIRIGGTDDLTMDKLNDMTFLDKCINESLRLHPPLPMNDRICLQDYKFPGTDIILEKGTSVYVAVYGTNTDPRFFKDPEKFDPMRTDSDSLGFSAAHMSFGIGPRSCIGQRFGLLITKVALVTILGKYTLNCKTSMEPELKTGTMFTTAVNGIPLRMQKRL